MSRLGRDRAAAGRFGGVELTLRAQHRAKVAQSVGMARLERQRAPIADLGLVQVTDGLQHVAEIVEGIGVTRRRFGCTANEQRRLVAAPALLFEQAEEMQGVRLRRIGFQNAAVDCLGLGESAGAMHADGTLQMTRHVVGAVASAQFTPHAAGSQWSRLSALRWQYRYA